MYHEHADGTVDFNLGQGYQHLTGAEASGYMRYLDGDGEISRTQRQERFVKAFMKMAFSISALPICSESTGFGIM